MAKYKPTGEMGLSRKMFDFGCPLCKKEWESFCKQAEIDSGEIRCPDCNIPGVKLISAVGIDGSAASAWRRR